MSSSSYNNMKLKVIQLEAINEILSDMAKEKQNELIEAKKPRYSRAWLLFLTGMLSGLTISLILILISGGVKP